MTKKVVKLNTGKMEEHEAEEEQKRALEEVLENLLERAKSGQLKNLVFAGELDDETMAFITGYANCSYEIQHRLHSEIHMDIVGRYIDMNYIHG